MTSGRALHRLPLPRIGERYLWDDYYVIVAHFRRHAGGFQVVFTRAGQPAFHTAGLSEFMVAAQHQSML
jgi:hypothetical protein